MIAETMRCPTCGVRQPWSDACRRCKSDLRLLREAAEEYAALRRECLLSIRRNRTRAALELARRCRTLHDDDDSRRLLAVCELLNGDWCSAHSLAFQLMAGDSAQRGPEDNGR